MIMGNKNDTSNISVPYYDNFYQINDRHDFPLTNVYWSSPKTDTPSIGTVYLFHGYGGSPVEPCMKIPMQTALANGFDVVAIEGVALSATYGIHKNITAMNLSRQKRAIIEGLDFCKDLPGVNGDNRIAWSHSLSCRAISDLIVTNRPVNSFFKWLVLNNPYFLQPSRAIIAQQRIMQRDPSGQSLHTALQRTSIQRRKIENQEFQIPTRMKNLAVTLPSDWSQLNGKLPDITKRMSKFIEHLRIIFLLGTADNMAEYSQNVEIFNGLTALNKELISIKDADHVFENKLPEFENSVNIILKHIKTTCENHK